MSDIAILNRYRKKKFEEPPQFNEKTRHAYFTPNRKAVKALNKIRDDVDKVGFLLQFGYFQAKAHFYPGEYYPVDKKFVEKRLKTGEVNLEEYSAVTASRHKALILKMLGWSRVTEKDKETMIEYVEILVDKQQTLEDMLFALLSKSWTARKECLSLSQYSQIISKGLRSFDKNKATLLNEHITEDQRSELISLIDDPSLSQKFNDLHKIAQGSKKVKDIKQNEEALSLLKDIFKTVEPLIKPLDFSNNTVKYYADKAKRDSVASLQKLTDTDDVTLTLLGFVIDQFRERQDAAVMSIMKVIRELSNAANTHERKQRKKKESELEDAKKSVVYSARMLRKLMGQIYNILKNTGRPSSDRCEEVITILKNFFSTEDSGLPDHIQRIETNLKEGKQKADFNHYIFEKSIKIQRHISPLLKHIIFDEENCEQNLYEAMQYFIEHDGAIDENHAPMGFLTRPERSLLNVESEHPFASRYKALLFLHFERGIRSRKLVLRHSYRFLPLQDMMIDELEWKLKKAQYIEAAGLHEFRDWETVFKEVSAGVNDKFRIVNERLRKGENKYLTINEKTGDFKLQDYEPDYSQDQYISGILKDADNITVQEIIAQIDKRVNFSGMFVHKLVRGTKRIIEETSIYATLMSLATNKGHYDMSKSMSPPTNAKKLIDTELYRFSVTNLKKVNQAILDYKDKLSLSSLFADDEDIVHSSSDGQKIVVAVNSLLATYSYKYYGKAQGITVNTFVDDRDSFFHVNVLSSSHREAAYMMDGISVSSDRPHQKPADYRVNEEEMIKRIRVHSTDEHGFSYAVFSGLHFLKVGFAPRFKDIEHTSLYTVGNDFFGPDCGHQIYAKNKVSAKKIEAQWDNILRVMATIKLGHVPASAMMTHLSSSSISSDLYNAMKEFGKLLKTQYVLSYINDVDLRKQVQKSLSRAEHGQNFRKAIFNQRDGEFQRGDLENYPKAMWCVAIIKNAVILWNYLYLTDYLLSLETDEEREEAIEEISKGSVIAWAHVNFTGIYDFMNLFNKSFTSTEKQMFKFKI